MFRDLRFVFFALVAFAIVASSMPAVAQEATPAAACPTTTPEENEALARMFWDEVVWADQGTSRDLLADDVVFHWGLGDDTTGPDAFAERFAGFLAGFPDLEYRIDDVAAEDDLVVILRTSLGTHRGEWQGIAPTGNAVSWSGISVFRIACGRIAESWGEADYLGLMAQLGAPDVPAFLAAAVDATPVAEAAATPCPEDAPEANLAIARRWTEEVWTNQALDVLDEIASPAIVHHGAAFPVVHGVDELKAAMSRQFAAFPDVVYTVDNAFAAGDTVVVRWSGTGTHGGEFLGIPATGAAVDFTGINVYHLVCGRIVESWSEMSGLDLVRQIQEAAAGVATPTG